MEVLSSEQFERIASKLNSDPASIQSAFTRITNGGVPSVRFHVEGDKPGEQPAGVATLKTDGGKPPRILFHSHRDQSR